MPLPALIKPWVRDDLFEVAEWYQEREPDSTLAIELLDEFEAVLALVCERPEAFPAYDGAVRRALLKQFPYAIYYEVEPEQVVVLSFLAMKQETGPRHVR